VRRARRKGSAEAVLERELCDLDPVQPEERSLGAQHRLGAPPDSGVERRWEIFCPPHLDHLELDAQLPARGFEVLHDEILDLSRESEHSHPRKPWHDLLEELHSFCHKVRGEVGHARHVASRVREAGDDPEFDRIEARRRHDGNRRGCFLHGYRPEGNRRDDEVRLQPDEVSGQARECVGAPFRIADLEDVSPALDVSELTQAAA